MLFDQRIINEPSFAAPTMKYVVFTKDCWHLHKKADKETYVFMGFLYPGERFNRFRLLTSRDYDNFYIKLKLPKDMCAVLNTLQSQAFEINRIFLNFIEQNYETLVEGGLLFNRRLASVNLKKASDLLRFCYLNDKGVQGVCTLHDFRFLTAGSAS